MSSLLETVTDIKDSVNDLKRRVDSLESQPSQAPLLSSRSNLASSETTPSQPQSANCHFMQPPLNYCVPPPTVFQPREYDLSSAYSQIMSSSPSAAAGGPEQVAGPGPLSRAVRTQYGYAAHSLPDVVSVSPALRQAIVQGKDINLSALLIPFFRGSGDNSEKLDASKETRAPNKPLTIIQFIRAFSKFKAIMCSAFPSRRPELDAYEDLIVDMADRRPGFGFYEYHCQFSQKAAAYLRHSNIAIDWSIRDEVLHNNIFAGKPVYSCAHCNSSSHGTSFCLQELESPRPLLPHSDRRQLGNFDERPSSNAAQSSVDAHGRQRIFHMHKEVCNNFNSTYGCRAPKCPRTHVCSSCKGNHARSSCPLDQASSQQAKNQTTPQTKKA